MVELRWFSFYIFSCCKNTVKTKVYLWHGIQGDRKHRLGESNQTFPSSDIYLLSIHQIGSSIHKFQSFLFGYQRVNFRQFTCQITSSRWQMKTFEFSYETFTNLRLPKICQDFLSFIMASFYVVLKLMWIKLGICELLRWPSFYSWLKLWWCVKRLLILIVELFVACLKDIFYPNFHWYDNLFVCKDKQIGGVEETSIFRGISTLP